MTPKILVATNPTARLSSQGSHSPVATTKVISAISTLTRPKPCYGCNTQRLARDPTFNIAKYIFQTNFEPHLQPSKPYQMNCNSLPHLNPHKHNKTYQCYQNSHWFTPKILWTSLRKINLKIEHHKVSMVQSYLNTKLSFFDYWIGTSKPQVWSLAFNSPKLGLETKNRMERRRHIVQGKGNPIFPLFLHSNLAYIQPCFCIPF